MDQTEEEYPPAPIEPGHVMSEAAWNRIKDQLAPQQQK